MALIFLTLENVSFHIPYFVSIDVKGNMRKILTESDNCTATPNALKLT